MKVEKISGVGKLSSGEFHTLAVNKDGALYSWGSPSFGKVGLKGSECIVEPRNVERVLKLRKKDLTNKRTDRAGIAIDSPVPEEIKEEIDYGKKKKKPEYNPVSDVACGRYNSLFVINSKVYSVGFKSGILGVKPRKGKDLQPVLNYDVL